MLVAGHRLERKHLRHGLLLEVYHQAHHGGRVLADADGRNIRIVRLDFGDQLLEFAVQLQAFDVYGQTWRVIHQRLFGRQRHIGLQRHAGVVFGRPYANGHNGGSKGQVLFAGQQQGQAASLQQGASVRSVSGK